ncbi:MAG: NADH:ubiquinone oxidoreductase subunit NDUFA12 [Rhodospirillales bacterium]|nr:NADH:ubiquinone oxidoreductase subunit NDUFA12 [Rhodospirillales bacterium]MCW8861427.1 NADH:ubiquinone oxidoreductase subunit NDUFA12 [Rhodospirillales bacterium]MCW8953065.1 NADH:ubiquinone oxidoreductase subunit NDUFA12 [Rhodospirillales bacterium]MCW8970372.1 NADH:ubiquinone oxidoreductase subunit NDUFA12 [Rhodospirillales bacterium]MCW9001321.1 NADH:ubiquinone oxidoreductase subunit NDUFA12 [Rhodospirillales bacterium]
MHVGTKLLTWFFGELVGTDEFGNRYYRNRRRRRHGRELRWVWYKGSPEPSKVPPEWHAWIHHTTDEPLTESAAQARDWQQGHLPNMTGTATAYRPSGHDRRGGHRGPATGDYQAWTPGPVPGK